MSAEVIQFVPRVDRHPPRHAVACPVIHWPKPDDLVMDHADTAPCGYAAPSNERRSDDGLT